MYINILLHINKAYLLIVVSLSSHICRFWFHRSVLNSTYLFVRPIFVSFSFLVFDRIAKMMNVFLVRFCFQLNSENTRIIIMSIFRRTTHINISCFDDAISSSLSFELITHFFFFFAISRSFVLRVLLIVMDITSKNVYK